MNKAMAVSVDTVAFTPFPGLPFELRDTIWKMVAHQARVIYLSTHGTGYDIINGGYLGRLQQTAQGPGLLYANSESRAVGLAIYKKWYTGNVLSQKLPGFATYINPGCDTLLITTPAHFGLYPTFNRRGRRIRTQDHPSSGISLVSSSTFPWVEGEAVFSMCSERKGWSFDAQMGGENTYLLIKKHIKDMPLAKKREMLSIKMVGSYCQGGMLSAVGDLEEDFLGNWGECWVRFRS